MTLSAVLPGVADPDLEDEADRFPTCECRHGDDACGAHATARVTAVCAVPDCDCAAWTALACDFCLLSWKRAARDSGYRLRVHPLR